MEDFLKFTANTVAVLLAIYFFFGFLSIHNQISHQTDQPGLGRSVVKDIASNTMDLLSEAANEIRKISGHGANPSTSVVDVVQIRESEPYLELTSVDKLSIPALYPVKGKLEISSGYGYRKDPFTGKTAFHNGIDIPLKTGQPVYATGNGLIVDTGNDRFLGNYIEIKHELGYTSIYGHLSRITVRKHQKVNAGELIAYSGNTGRSTGPHLHYQINYRGLPIDPLGLKNSLITALNE